MKPLRRKTTRHYYGVLLGIVLLAGLFITAGCASSTPKAATGSESKEPVVGLGVGNIAPDFSISMLDGKTIKLSELRGKPVFLNFWATWCPPCNLEMPDIEKTFKDNYPVQIIAVDIREAPMTVAGFLSRKGYSYPVGLDLKGEIAGLYMADAIPASFGIDAKGIIRYEQSGPLTYTQLNQWFTGLTDTNK